MIRGSSELADSSGEGIWLTGLPTNAAPRIASRGHSLQNEHSDKMFRMNVPEFRRSSNLERIALLRLACFRVGWHDLRGGSLQSPDNCTCAVEVDYRTE